MHLHCLEIDIFFLNYYIHSNDSVVLHLTLAGRGRASRRAAPRIETTRLVRQGLIMTVRRELGTKCAQSQKSPALGLLVPECNVALALWTVLRSWLPHGSTSFLYTTFMHASVSLCVYALVHVCACTRDHAPRILKIHPWDCNLRWNSSSQSSFTYHLQFNLYYALCVHPSMHVSVSVCACMDVSVHNIMCSAGPEVAVLDWYGPEADPVYWRRGRGGGGGRTSGSVWSTHSRGESIGPPPTPPPPPPPEKIGNLDHLIVIIYPVLQIFSVGSHWQGIVISYLPSTPISLSCLCNSSTVYKVHYCIIIKYARSSNNSNCPQNNQNYSYIHARALKNPRN